MKRTACLIAISLLFHTIPFNAYATSNTQKKIDQAEQEKNELENKIDQTETELEGLKGEQSSLRNALKNLNSQLNQVADNLNLLEEQIAEKEQEITDTKAALEEARDTEEGQYDALRQRLRYIYEYGDIDYLEAILGVSSYSDLLNLSDYYEQIAAYDQRKLEEYEENRLYIEAEEQRLTEEKNELDLLKVQTEAEKSKISGLISQTANSITDKTGQISEAEQQALDFEQQLLEKEKDIDYWRKKLAEEQAMSKAAANSAWRDISEVSFADGDRYLLANLIYCEAGGESYEGQVAVGAVVINRVLSSVYPNSLVGVIYQSGQFAPVASGRLAIALAENRATANCYKAADEAMSGGSNVGNCVYFRTPIEGLTGISIGGHIFY